jgi:hypothetical protein
MDAGLSDSTVVDGKSGGDSGDAKVEASLDAAKDSGPPDAVLDAIQDDAVPDAIVPDAPVAVCQLKPIGEPVEVFALPGQDLYTPSMVVMEPGNLANSKLPRVALQAVADGIRLIAMTVHPPGPSGTIVDTNTPVLVGTGMTYGQMVHAPGSLEQLALVWGADGPGNVLRTVDISSWTLGPLVTVATTGWTPNGLAAGKGVPNTQTGQYDGNGYAMTWQGATGVSASMAVLSATGEIQVGPLWTSAPAPSQQLESTVAWSGSTYLMATRFETCAAGDPLCRERAVVVSRLRVAPASNSIEYASSFESGIPGWTPGYPTLDGTVLAYDDGPGSKQARVFHIQQLADNGVPVDSGHVVASGIYPLARVLVGSGPDGKVAGWVEEGDVSLSDQALGRSSLWLQLLDKGLGLQGPVVVLPMTRYGSVGHPVIVPLGFPRGVLVAWSALSRTSLRHVIFAQFVPCAG